MIEHDGLPPQQQQQQQQQQRTRYNVCDDVLHIEIDRSNER